jgi:hypothetical protein
MRLWGRRKAEVRRRMADRTFLPRQFRHRCARWRCADTQSYGVIAGSSDVAGGADVGATDRRGPGSPCSGTARAGPGCRGSRSTKSRPSAGRTRRRTRQICKGSACRPTASSPNGLGRERKWLAHVARPPATARLWLLPCRVPFSWSSSSRLRLIPWAHVLIFWRADKSAPVMQEGALLEHWRDRDARLHLGLS